MTATDEVRSTCQNVLWDMELDGDGVRWASLGCQELDAVAVDLDEFQPEIGRVACECSLELRRLINAASR